MYLYNKLKNHKVLNQYRLPLKNTKRSNSKSMQGQRNLPKNTLRKSCLDPLKPTGESCVKKLSKTPEKTIVRINKKDAKRSIKKASVGKVPKNSTKINNCQLKPRRLRGGEGSDSHGNEKKKHSDGQNLTSTNEDPQIRNETQNFTLGREETAANNVDQNDSSKLEKMLPDKSRSIINTSEKTENINTEPGIHEVITTSFVENLLEETVPILRNSLLPIPSNQVDASNFSSLPIESKASVTQYNLPDKNATNTKENSDLFCLLPSPEEICQKLNNLEKQVEQMNKELLFLHKELVPVDSLAKFNVLLKHFHEVDNILMELKINCTKLQSVENQLSQGRNQNENRNQPTTELTATESQINLQTRNSKTSKCALTPNSADFTYFNSANQLTNIPHIPNNIHHIPEYSENYRDQPDVVLMTQNEIISEANAEVKGLIEKLDASFESKMKTPCGEERDTSNNQGLPLSARKLSEKISEVVGNIKSSNIALTIFLESNNLFNINISVIQTGQCLGVVYTNEAAFKQAYKNELFNNFILLFVFKSNTSEDKDNKNLVKSFEFVLTRDNESI